MTLGFKEVATCVVLSLPLAACENEAAIRQNCQEVSEKARERAQEVVKMTEMNAHKLYDLPDQDAEKAKKECLEEHGLE